MSELKECWHIYIPREDVAGYRDPFSVWRSTKEAFPSAAFDAQESVRVWLRAIYAAVFHAMRILEVGIGCLAIKLGVPVKRQDKSWSSVLAAIRMKLTRNTRARASLQRKRRSTGNISRRYDQPLREGFEGHGVIISYCHTSVKYTRSKSESEGNYPARSRHRAFVANDRKMEETRKADLTQDGMP